MLKEALKCKNILKLDYENILNPKIHLKKFFDLYLKIDFTLRHNFSYEKFSISIFFSRGVLYLASSALEYSRF